MHYLIKTRFIQQRSIWQPAAATIPPNCGANKHSCSCLCSSLKSLRENLQTFLLLYTCFGHFLLYSMILWCMMRHSYGCLHTNNVFSDSSACFYMQREQGGVRRSVTNGGFSGDVVARHLLRGKALWLVVKSAISVGVR
jgi:hypothetical protein